MMTTLSKTWYRVNMKYSNLEFALGARPFSNKIWNLKWMISSITNVAGILRPRFVGEIHSIEYLNITEKFIQIVLLLIKKNHWNLSEIFQI